MAISRTDFDYISQLTRSHAAIVLEPGKEYLVETRLGTLAEKEGFTSLEQMIGRMRSESGFRDLHHKTIDALTTNETFFFRDFHPFEALRKEVLPKILEKRNAVRQLNIWSAACSTGQEPYSLAMLIYEHFPLARDWKINILATDLSPTVLKTATAGSYTQFEVNRGLPAVYLVKYFTKQADRWVIKDEIRRMVQFKPMNLIQPWPMMPPLDLIFIRNVMIYFDVATKKMILKRVRGCLQPHGYLFLGTAETTMNLDPDFLPTPFGNTTAYGLGRKA